MWAPVKWKDVLEEYGSETGVGPWGPSFYFLHFSSPRMSPCLSLGFPILGHQFLFDYKHSASSKHFPCTSWQLWYSVNRTGPRSIFPLTVAWGQIDYVATLNNMSKEEWSFLHLPISFVVTPSFVSVSTHNQGSKSGNDRSNSHVYSGQEMWWLLYQRSLV